MRSHFCTFELYQISQKKFNTKIGWSDHTNNKYVILEAHNSIRLHIELHVDLDDKNVEVSKAMLVIVIKYQK